MTRRFCAWLASRNRSVPHSCFLPNRENAPARICIFLLLINSFTRFWRIFLRCLSLFSQTNDAQRNKRKYFYNFFPSLSSSCSSFLLLLQQFNFSPLFYYLAPAFVRLSWAACSARCSEFIFFRSRICFTTFQFIMLSNAFCSLADLLASSGRDFSTKKSSRSNNKSIINGGQDDGCCIIKSFPFCFFFSFCPSNLENLIPFHFIMSPAGACIKARFCSMFFFDSSSTRPHSFAPSLAPTWLDSKIFYVFSSRILFSTPSNQTVIHITLRARAESNRKKSHPASRKKTSLEEKEQQE